MKKKQLEKKYSFAKEKIEIGFQKYFVCDFPATLLYYCVGERGEDPRIKKHTILKTESCITLHIPSYEDVKSVLTIGNLCGSEVELESKNGDRTVSERCTMGGKLVVRFTNKGPYYKTTSIGYVLRELRNPKRWEVVLEDDKRYICILPTYNIDKKEWNYAKAGCYNARRGGINFKIIEYYPVRMQFSMLGRLRILGHTFLYTTKKYQHNIDDYNGFYGRTTDEKPVNPFEKYHRVVTKPGNCFRNNEHVDNDYDSDYDESDSDES